MNEKNKKKWYFFKSTAIIFQSTMDITTYDDDFDVCYPVKNVPKSAIEDDGTKNKK